MNLSNRVQYVPGTRSVKTSKPSWSVGILAVASALALAGTLLSDSNAVIAQEREGRRSPEAEAGERRSPEADAGPRRSPEADAGPRRASEREGRRRSPEADTARRRPAERDEGGRRLGEGERNNADRRESGQGGPAEVFQGFKPQTEREAALFQMIVRLQREIDELRREVRSSGRRDRDRTDAIRRDGDAARRDPALGEHDRPVAGRDKDGLSDRAEFVLPPNWKNTKDGRVFQAYDKNGDESVSLEEWLAMTNGNVSDARRRLQTRRYNEAEPDGDGKFTPVEFIYWYSIGRHRDVEHGRRDGARDGDREQRGRPGEARERRGRRDGDERIRRPRDGEGDGRGRREVAPDADRARDKDPE